MPALGNIGKALGGKNVGKLIGDNLAKNALGGISKALKDTMGQGGPMDDIVKKAMDSLKKAETQGKELVKVATDADKKGEEAVGEAVGNMKKLIDSQANLMSGLEKMLQDALDKAKSEGEGAEEGGGGKGKSKGKGKGKGAEDAAKSIEEALKKVSEITKMANASKKDVAKAKKNGDKKRGGGGGGGGQGGRGGN